MATPPVRSKTPASATQDSVAAGDETAVFDGAKRADDGDVTLALNQQELDAQAKKATAKSNTLGDFKLLKKLGQGGMGTVYRAHQISLDRDAAVKVLSKELAAKPAFVQRFLREARLMAKLDHPNILRCFEVGDALGYHFIAMEYVNGGSVETWLKKLKQFDIGDALYIAITVASALQHAHEQGLVHRDIKPDNVLLTAKGVIKVADLGLAKATDDDLGLTRTGTGAGTPVYMAPEQARDAKHVDHRCDIYALGVMLYVFLTGQAPFGGSTLVEVIEAKEKGKFKPIRMFNPEVPDRLDLIVDKMLARDPKLRFASCTDVVEELEALGLASEGLSFFTAVADTVRAKAPSTKMPVAAAAAAAQAPKVASAPTVDPDIWYWTFKDPAGKTVTKKVTTSELTTLIKTGSVDNKAQVSKTLHGGYRALGACPEFESYFRGKVAEKKAGRGVERYKSMLQEIEAAEDRRQRMKWLKGLFGKFGSAVGLLVWLAVLGAGIAGGYFAVTWVMEKMR
jgi:eukaryotic-like serine/threonine-protein kinase